MRERWKAPREGNEIVPETIGWQADEADLFCDVVPIEEWAGELIYIPSLSKVSLAEAQWKRALTGRLGV